MQEMISDYGLWALLDASGFAIYRLRELELVPFGLTVEKSAVLRLLQAARRGSTMKTLCDQTLRQHNTVSTLVNRMCRAGLIMSERRPGHKDSTITLTDEGRSVFKRIPTTQLENVFSVLSVEQKMRFSNSMRSLYDKARSLIVPDRTTFMQYVTSNTALAEPAQDYQTSNIPSAYVLWSQLDGTRFAVSRLRELELARLGLTVEQASFLRVLADAGRSITAKDLEDASLRQHHSVSTLVERMTKMGLVEKKKTAGERRHRINITQRGKKLLSGLPTVALEMTFSALTGTEKRQLAASLLLLRRRARELLGAAPDTIR